jgi:hypothetical protein
MERAVDCRIEDATRWLEMACAVATDPMLPAATMSDAVVSHARDLFASRLEFERRDPESRLTNLLTPKFMTIEPTPLVGSTSY